MLDKDQYKAYSKQYGLRPVQIINFRHCDIIVSDDDDTLYSLDDWGDWEVQLLQATGLLAAKSYRGDSEDDRMIYEGDITELVLPDGEIRQFEVAIETVIREVKSHPTFDTPFAKVAITGVVFKWNGFELFPCVDENGVADTSKMSIIGTIYDKEK